MPTGQMEINQESLASPSKSEELSLFSSFLRHLLREDRSEITRVAKELEVAENTIYRWMNGASEPRVMHLKRLPEVLPEYRVDLISVINQTFPGVVDLPAPGIHEVPKEIYNRVLDLVATTFEEETCFWQISQILFEHALLHLDAEHQGLVIIYARLMPPHEDGIHSLYESISHGHDPWPFVSESRVYLGSTSLAGTAAMLQRMQVWDAQEGEDRLQVEVDEFEASACATPVMRKGRISGVLIVSSVQSGFFSDPMARHAVGEYALLLSTAIQEHDFYPCSSLNLRPMPSIKWQRTRIAESYVQRIITYARVHEIARVEAELRVRDEMELEFENLGRLSGEQCLAILEKTHNAVQSQERNLSGQS